MILDGTALEIENSINALINLIEDCGRRFSIDSSISDNSKLIKYAQISDELMPKNRHESSAYYKIALIEEKLIDTLFKKINASSDKKRKISELDFVLRHADKLLRVIYHFNESVIAPLESNREKISNQMSDDMDRFFKKTNKETEKYYAILRDSGYSRWSIVIDNSKKLNSTLNKLNSELDLMRSEQLNQDLIAKDELKNKKLLELYKSQMDMMIQYKKEGLAIESEIFSMREKLLNLEKQENSAMLQELMQTLDSI